MTELEIILNTYFNTHIKVGDVKVWVKEIINKFLNTYGYSTTKQFASNGGKARASKLSKKQLSKIGKMGADARYKKVDVEEDLQAKEDKATAMMLQRIKTKNKAVKNTRILLN